MKTIIRTVFLLFYFLSSVAFAQDKQITVSWNSEDGKELRVRIPVDADFWRLVPSFSGQQNQAFCGVASAITVLNAMDIKKPVDPLYYPYRYFTQSNFFTAEVMKVITPQSVFSMGVTRDELAKTLEAHGVKVKSISGDSFKDKELRTLLKNSLGDDGKFMLANYLRTAVGQKGWGHWSVLASYDPETDRVLILDVEKFKYNPVWIEVNTLNKAINTMDSTSKKPRGLIVVYE